MSQDDTDRVKLARLADALLEDIIATPDVDIIAEVDFASIERARIILIEAKATLSRRLLAEAKAHFEAWQTAQPRARHSPDRATARDGFESIRRADPVFDQKITIAARNGKAPTDNDKEGLIEDWADLRRLDEQDTPE